MLRRISEFAAGRRSKWAIIAFWVLLAFALGQFQPKLQEATTNENEAFLPASAESTEVNNILDEDFAQGREVEALVAYTRDGELSTSDRQRIAADAQAICTSDELEDGLVVINPFGEPCVPAGAAQSGWA